MEELKQHIATACLELFDTSVDVELSRTEEKFGDYATNVAMQLVGKMANPPAGGPREIAQAIASKLSSHDISRIDVAGPGFLNLTLSDEALVKMLGAEPSRPLAGKVVVAEYSDPNPFKVLHAGHLYTSVVGNAIASLLENAGATVHRVNFGGDVGLHVGRTMWAIIEKLGGEYPDGLNAIAHEERAAWMAECYVRGTAAYEEDEGAKARIIELNRLIYRLHAEQIHDTDFAKIYWTCRTWSYEYFDAFYARIGCHFEKYYPESEVASLGLRTVLEQQEKGVFEESGGAIVFDGEKYGLHTRVFINSQGIPTYEAKDVGLIMTKWNDYHFDRSVVITGNEQEQYMAVVLKAVEQFAPELAHATSHLTHGILKMAGGVKMSSRLGNILRAVDVLDAAADANQQATGKHDESVELGAVKYALLKQRTGGDIIYDPLASVSLEGNSGPYLQYAHARARSILAKKELPTEPVASFDQGERSLARKIGEYAEVVERSVSELMPHYICTYLYELAQVFNRFYEHNRVIDDPREAVRLQLIEAYASTLKNGLGLLGIHAPEKM